MSSQGDPYRTLGVAPGASLNEIKSAYRRLAKKYHPDTAGERALPRFLAIQAAYEGLVDGEGRLRRDAEPPGPGGAEGRPPASREAWRARRARGERGGGTGTTGTAGATRPAGHRPPGSGTTNRRYRRGHADAHAGPRRATPGSTTYDEAAETPLDPEWDGGAWYGPSSGTYWTLNPREYADPRKHGPEYLERARRAAGGAAPGGPGPDAAQDDDPRTAGDDG